MRPGKDAAPELVFFDWKDGDLVFAVSDGVSGACRSWELEAFIVYWLASNISADLLGSQILRFVAANLHDNASIALSVRGTPKPFAQDAATLELQVLARCGLRQEVLQSLDYLPSRLRRVDTRQQPLGDISSRVRIVSQDGIRALLHSRAQPRTITLFA